MVIVLVGIAVFLGISFLLVLAYHKEFGLRVGGRV
jgi:hypothetical protein